MVFPKEDSFPSCILSSIVSAPARNLPVLLFASAPGLRKSLPAHQLPRCAPVTVSFPHLNTNDNGARAAAVVSGETSGQVMRVGSKLSPLDTCFGHFIELGGRNKLKVRKKEKISLVKEADVRNREKDRVCCN